MSWLQSILLPPEGSAYAAQHDVFFIALVLLCAFFFLLIAGILTYFVWRYRRRGDDDVTPDIKYNYKLEVIWSVIPLIIVIVIFFWGFQDYVNATTAPGDAMEIQVTARKWVWQFEYPDGTRTLNELHVPVGRPVRMVMSSEDVIHSFYVPTFRVKKDVVPNMYTELWFQPREEGVHQLLCAEYCGAGHSNMLGKIYVESEDKFRQWQEQGDTASQNMPLAELGAMLYQSRGCNVCHSIDGSRGDGPSFKGIFGQTHHFTDGTSAVVDENYIRQSIQQPQAKIRDGFQGIMPTFQGLLRDREISALAEFIKAQK